MVLYTMRQKQCHLMTHACRKLGRVTLGVDFMSKQTVISDRLVTIQVRDCRPCLVLLGALPVE